MNQKRFTSIILIGVVVVLLGVGGYFAWLEYGAQPCAESLRPAEAVNKKTGEKKIFEYPCAVPRGWIITDYHPVTTPESNQTFSEPEILASLKTDWQSTQMLIAFRPAYHNEAEDAKKVWRSPTAVQFIGKNNVLVRFEDDNNVHVAILNFNGSEFNLLEVFRNQSEFTLSDWQNLIIKYGDSKYVYSDPASTISTYTTGLVRNGQIVSFQNLTNVSENIFVKNYIVQQPTSTQATPVSPTPTPSKPIATTVQNPVDAKWKMFQNSRFAFQFEYPAQWSVLDKVDDPYGIGFWLEENGPVDGYMVTMIMDIETGINLSLMGVPYCGAYPQDKRCESLKTESGYVTIDWDVSGKANAMLSSQDGTSGVSFTLHKVNSETKNTFRKILSTFKFLK